jgi:multiple sugar transport system permease protein
VRKEQSINSVMVNRKKIEPFFYLLPAFIVMATITVYPFIYNVLLSFQEWNLTTFRGKHFVGGQNYLEIFRNPDVWNSLRVTGIYLVTCVGFEFILGLAIAFLINSEFRGKTAVRGLLLFPMIMSPVIAGLVWRWIFNAEWGLANYMVNLIGVSSKPWLTKPRLALFSVILADIWQWTPFIVLVALAGLQAIPEELIEASGVDGASWWQIQRYISLPILKPVLLIGLLLRTIDGLRFVDKIFVMTYGGPGSATSVFGFFTYLKGFKFFQMGRTAALSIVLLAIIIFLANVFIRLFRGAR